MGDTFARLAGCVGKDAASALAQISARRHATEGRRDWSCRKRRERQSRRGAERHYWEMA